MELNLPHLGENITQGTVTKILVKTGDAITKGQSILELETDKAVLEVPASEGGVVSDILIKTGAVVNVGQAILKLDGSAAPAPTQEKPSEKPNTPPPQEQLKKTEAPESKAQQAAPLGDVSDFILPVLGENILKGTVTKILVKIGDQVKKDQSILEIETDKAVLEVPSSSNFIVKEILIKAGSVINVGAPVFKIQNLVASVQKPVASSSPVKAKSDASDPVIVAAPLQTTVASSNAALPVRTNISAAPSVRLFAREIGIDIGQVLGSGSGGRISIDDVKKFSKALNTSRVVSGSTVAQHPLPDFSKWGDVKHEAMNNVRKKTADHLTVAWTTIPHVTQFDKADITEIEKLRKEISTPKVKVSITPYIIKALALALKKFPQFNTSVDMATHEIIFKNYFNIGVAVDTDRGLIVPVLKKVDTMSVLEINEALTSIAERARTRKITLDDLQGGCFTLSNLGGIGGTFFTPIVNTPEVAILGVSRGVMEPVYTNGAFMPRLMLPLSLSYDHRVIDGADGARFIRWIAQAIEQPAQFDLNK